MSQFGIRAAEPRDNEAIRSIIQAVMPEFGADGPGFAIHDPEVLAMFEAYNRPRAKYFVVEIEDIVLGGGGIAPLEDGDPDICELRKMYFLPKLRGLGAGAAMMQVCLDFAKQAGFRQCYLETLTGMDAAAKLYERSGFKRIPESMGATGHFGCNRFYLRDL